MTVQILLSTYNGEPYLKELLDSLLAQDYPDLKILARDDGSADSTCSILRDYAAAHQNIEVIEGEHCGFIRSFFSLIQVSSKTAGYFALCDQDDVWQPDKLSRAVARLTVCGDQTPALYASRVTLVDENLSLLGYSNLPKRELSFCNALVECPFPGCTFVFNQAARELFLRKAPAQAWSHDIWMYLIVSALGTILYDCEPRILYRQHGGNSIGMPSGAVQKWKIKIERFLHDAKLRHFTRQAEEFKTIYGPLLARDQASILDRFLSGRTTLTGRLRYALAGDVYRQSRLDHWILKARIALDYL